MRSWSDLRDWGSAEMPTPLAVFLDFLTGPDPELGDPEVPPSPTLKTDWYWSS